MRELGEGVAVAGGPTPRTAALDLDALVKPGGRAAGGRSPRGRRTSPASRTCRAYPRLACRAAEALPRAGSITGVGSSALGSAALARNVAKALGAPVIAVVPGYGVADAVQQALGGWFGFGLHEALGTKSALQTWLADYAPELAWVGRKLVASTPAHGRASTGAPTFLRGCGSSDVLHALMEQIEIDCLVGHSKGALAIGNALEGLAASRTRGLRIVTLGCPIPTTVPGASYHQHLGIFDALGQLNAWGNPPTDWTPTQHTTNRALPLAMDAVALVAA